MSDVESTARARIAAARRLVVKLGTSVVMDDDGSVALGRVYGLVESAARLRRAGREVILVSSGAVGLGMQKLGMAARPEPLELKQACAAVGQSRLMALYDHAFEKLGRVAAQVLLTEGDLADPARRRNLRATLERLLDLGTVPVLNENDAVSTAELEPTEGRVGREAAFGDNDHLSARVVEKVGADLLVLLSDVDGLYTADPSRDPLARRIPVVAGAPAAAGRWAEGAGSRGRGGMKTKLEAARIAVEAGAIAVIAGGRVPGILDRLLAGEPAGTLFIAGAAVGAGR